MVQIHHHLLFLFIINFYFMLIASTGTVNLGVGVIVDMDSSVGKTTNICIKMAINDFYQTHPNYTTKIIPHFHNSKSDTLQAASAAIQLLKDEQVIAIIGPHRSSQADFVVDIGNKSKVPILSLATSASISPIENPYFIRVSHNSSAQAQPIAAFIKSFSWREVVFVHEQTDFGRGFIPYLSEALLNIGARIKYWSVISSSPSDTEISEELTKLKANQTRVFVVHLLPKSASIFFKIANEMGMMQKEYVWIVTDVLTSLLHTLNISSMQGVVGVKPYIPKSIKLNKFEKRWKRRYHSENPNTEMERIELCVFGIWSYDATYALAMALERVGTDISPTFQRKNNPITDLDAIGTSKLGPRLLTEIKKTRLNGLSGNFSVVNGQLQPSDYQIVNVVEKGEKSVGFWSWHDGILKLKDIKWPGNSISNPQGWQIPATNKNKFMVGFPSKGGFIEFITTDPINKNKPIGFCVDVFEAVMEALQPLALPYDYKPFNIDDGGKSRSYNDLVYQIFLKECDMVIGDVTIRANRSTYVDFTLPYTESGVSMVVPIKVDDRKNAWIFMEPLEKGLWLTTFAFFIYTGVVIWILEHRVNREFRGKPYKQVGMIFWFSFSTLVFAHKEKMISNLSRFVVIVWIFVVLVLQSSYIASLTSMLTVQQLQPDFTDIHDLLKKGDNVGYKEGSFVEQMLLDMGFEDNNLISYKSLEEFDQALTNGSVSAIFDELPYVNLFMAQHCNKYIKVGQTYKTAGFGFAFPLGSPLVPLVSKAILEVRENKLNDISNKWLNKGNCKPKNGTVVSSGSLSLDSFTGLFLIAGISSTSALIISILRFLYENRGILASEGSITQKIHAFATTFDQEKDQSSSSNKPNKTTSDSLGTTDDDDEGEGEEDLSVIENDISSNAPSPENSINHEAGVLSHDEATDIVETTIER